VTRLPSSCDRTRVDASAGARSTAATSSVRGVPLACPPPPPPSPRSCPPHTFIHAMVQAYKHTYRHKHSHTHRHRHTHAHTHAPRHTHSHTQGWLARAYGGKEMEAELSIVGVVEVLAGPEGRQARVHVTRQQLQEGRHVFGAD
jgi:hypothetical protein